MKTDKKYINIFLHILLILFFALNSYAQENYSTLSIESNLIGAKVFLDSNYIGNTPITNMKVYSGKYTLTVVYPDEKSWNRSIHSEDINLNEGENLKKYIELDNIFIINSNPSDAKVYLNDSLIGTTPLVYSTKSPEILVRIEKKNYESAVIKLNSVNTYQEIMLLQKELPNLNKSNLKSTHLTTETYIAVGTTIIFGTAAALLKVKADEHYKNYRATGDNNELSMVKKFDKFSGISLFLCEISNIALIYLLLLK